MFTCDQIKALIAGFLTMMIYGSAYTYGTLVPYIISYIYHHCTFSSDKADPTINGSRMAALLPFSFISLNLGMWLSNVKKIKFSNKINTLIAVGGMALSFLILSFFSSYEMYFVWYTLYSLSIGYGYLAPIKNCVQHIPERKGLCSGVCILGYGISALLFNFIFLLLLNPNNLSPQKLPDKRSIFTPEVADNVPFSLRIQAGMFMVIGIVAALLMNPPKPKVNLQENLQQSLIEIETAEESVADIKPTQQLKNNQLVASMSWKQQLAFLVHKKILWLILTLSTTLPFGIFLAFNYKEYALIKINNDAFITLAGSISAIFNGLGRLFWGVMLDKSSYKIISIITNALNLVFALTISFIVEVEALYLLMLCLVLFSYGGTYSIYPAFTMQVFGYIQGSRVYWFVFGGITFASLFQYVLRLLLVTENDKFNDFRTCFYIMAGMNLLALILSVTIKYDLYQPSGSDKVQSITNNTSKNVQQ